MAHLCSSHISQISGRRVYLEEIEGLLELKVCFDGALEYSFKDHQQGLSLSRGPEGLGIYTTKATGNVTKEERTAVVEEPPASCWSSGLHTSHVCHSCWNVLKKGTRAKQREDAKGISFCSSACLSSARNLLDHAGACLSSISASTSSHNTMKSIQSLLLLLCVRAMGDPNFAKLDFQLLLSRSFITEPSPPHVILASTDLYSRCSTLSNELSDFMYKKLGSDVLERLLNVLAHNTHQIPLIGLPSTCLSVILPTLSKLNHSCQPNCVLTRAPPSAQGKGLRISLHVINEELSANMAQLTVSYLSTLGGATAERRALLSSLFPCCCCSRCSRAESLAELAALEKHRESLILLGYAMQRKDQAMIFKATKTILECNPRLGLNQISSLPDVEMAVQAVGALVAALDTGNHKDQIVQDDIKAGLSFIDGSTAFLEAFFSGDNNCSDLVRHLGIKRSVLSEKKF